MKSTNAGTAPSMSGGYADRFQGPDSRYRKGYRQSTVNIFDQEAIANKQIDENAPVPEVQSDFQADQEQAKMSASERFGDHQSIYHDATKAPAVTAYDPTAAKDTSIQAGPGMDRVSQRFVGQDLIYNR